MVANILQGFSLAAIVRLWAICLVGLLPAAGNAQTGAGEKILSVNVALLEFNPGMPSDVHLGPLRYLGGLILAAEEPRFGGYSGLSIDADGGGLWAISDRGHWLRLDFDLDADAMPQKVRKAALYPMRGPDGKVMQSRSQLDAEGLRRDRSGGAWVSFEREHRLLYYPGGPASSQPPQKIDLPAETAALANNGGLESVAVLAGQGIGADLLLLAEDPLPGESGLSPLWLRRGGQWSRFSWPLHGEFRPTDAVALPGGRPAGRASAEEGESILVLERDFRWLAGWAARLSRVSLKAIGPGGVLQPETLAEWARPYANDNLEAMDIRRGPDGAIWLYLMSDDNHSRSQRNLLLVFRLEP